MKEIYDLIESIHENARNKGFHPSDESTRQFMANQCNNLHGEVSELWEAWRAGKEDELCDKKETGLTCTEEELADIVIRAFDLSKRLGFDILIAIQAKHSYNLTRPYKHGKLN